MATGANGEVSNHAVNPAEAAYQNGIDIVTIPHQLMVENLVLDQMSTLQNVTHIIVQVRFLSLKVSFLFSNDSFFP